MIDGIERDTYLKRRILNSYVAIIQLLGKELKIKRWSTKMVVKTNDIRANEAGFEWRLYNF